MHCRPRKTDCGPDHFRWPGLGQLFRTLGVPVILVTHDWVDALALGDKMLLMSAGRVLQTGPPLEVLTRPQHPEVALAVGVETLVTGRVRKREQGIAILDVGA